MLRYVVLLASSLCACVTPTSLQPARVLPKGEVAYGAALALHRGVAPFEDDTVQRLEWTPTGEISIRWGLAERTDCGARVWPFFVRGDCKLELTRSRWFDAAVGAGLGVLLPNPGGAFLDAYVPLSVDFNLWREPYQPGAVTLIASGGPVGRCYAAQGNPAFGCWLQAPASTGAMVQVSERFALVTEAAYFGTLVPPGPAVGTRNLSGFQLALGFQLRMPPPTARALLRD